jgi:prepilin-type N-terminal cleavage/methylation domain-containing protein
MYTLRDDRGFTLSELIVVVSLVVVLVAVSYGALYAVLNGFKTSDRQAQYTSDIGTPLLAIDDILVQNSTIAAAGPYSIVVYTDRNMDNVKERHTITAYSDGRLTMLTQLVNSQLVVTSTEQNWTMMRTNANVVQGVPLFTYRDYDYEPITDMGRVASDARSVDVRLVNTYDSRTLEASRTVQFRLRTN